MKIVDMRVSDLVPYGQNTKDHPADQVGRIAASIKEFGFNQPVLIDAAGCLVAGHGRVLAAKSLGLETVPTICVDHLNTEQVRAYRIADNKTAESDWLEDVLREELMDLRDAGYDLELTGFGDECLDVFDISETNLPSLADGDREPFQQITFTLHDEQVVLVKKAIAKAKKMGPFVDTCNENSNGNAIARMSEVFLG